MSKFAIGDLVEKYTGDYQVIGEVRMIGATKAGKLRYVIEIDPGFLMIYNESQLRLASMKAAPCAGARIET